MNVVFSPRLKKLQTALKPMEAWLLSNPRDIFYFTGFKSLVAEEREVFLVATSNKSYLIYTSFSPLPQYITQLQSNNQPLIKALVGCTPEKLITHLKEIQKQEEFKEIFLDAASLRVEEYIPLQSLKNLRLTIKDRKQIWNQRSVKNKHEIQLIKQACQISKKALAKLLPQLKVGITELEITKLLESIIQRLGSPKPAFPTIVAFGKHSSLPHHQPTSTKLKNNTPVLIDFGATYEDYCSDMTRTVWFGDDPTPEFLELETIVTQAYQRVLNLLRDHFSQNKGVRKRHQSLTAKQIDDAARSTIKNAGHHKHFVHTTGHGLGLDIHEPPSLSWFNKQTIKTGMTLTVEPGIYLPEQFGFRYENTVWIGGSGIEELTL